MTKLRGLTKRYLKMKTGTSWNNGEPKDTWATYWENNKYQNKGVTCFERIDRIFLNEVEVKEIKEKEVDEE